MAWTATPEQYEEARRNYLAEAGPRVDEEVLAAALFRPGGASAQFAASKAQLGALVYGAVKLARKRSAGGLPERVLLVVTPSKLHAFKWKYKGRKVRITDEVAVWDRAAIRCSTQAGGGMTAMTIESPADGQTATLVGGGIADDPISQEVMGLLARSDPSTP
jgi:hypothetical protein